MLTIAKQPQVRLSTASHTRPRNHSDQSMTNDEAYNLLIRLEPPQSYIRVKYRGIWPTIGVDYLSGKYGPNPRPLRWNIRTVGSHQAVAYEAKEQSGKVILVRMPDLPQRKAANQKQASPQKFGSAHETLTVDRDAIPSRLSLRDQTIFQIAQDADNEIARFSETERDFENASETLIESMVVRYKKIVEQFEGNHCAIDIGEMTAFLDHQNVKRHGNDKTVYARLVRLAKSRLRRNLRNKIAEGVAAASFFGIRSDEVVKRCRQGFEIGARKKVGTGISALVKAYKEDQALQRYAEVTIASHNEEDDVVAFEKFDDAPPMGWSHAVRALSDGLSSGQLTAHFRSRGGRKFKIGTVEIGRRGIVFVEE